MLVNNLMVESSWRKEKIRSYCYKLTYPHETSSAHNTKQTLSYSIAQPNDNFHSRRTFMHTMLHVLIANPSYLIARYS